MIISVLLKVGFILTQLEYFLIEAKTSDHFPDNFLFGFATASYQIEGGWKENGKGENVWDRLVHSHPKKVVDRSNGDVACDSYHKFKEDVQMLKDIGAQVYRFSLSWSRILPKGDVSKINRDGVNYYSNLLDELLSNEIQPMVTLFHWDLPQVLQDLGGWPNPLMAEYFEDYARLAFHLFGDRVKWWITFNEPFETCQSSYGGYDGAPALGLSGVADYLCGHTIIKSHARAYHIYNDEFRKVQKGNVGISLNGGWNEPLRNLKEDIEAANNALLFQIGWFLNPMISPEGDYPSIMRQRVDKNSEEEKRPRSRLPSFTDGWRAYIKGTLDFVGINHYTTYLTSPSQRHFKIPSFERDMNISLSQKKEWPGSSAPWLRVEPTENGYADKGELNDTKRINYYRGYLKELVKAINEDGCHVIGYIAWSIIDNFEWLLGYTARFGIYHVDFKSRNRTRTPKSSSKFFKELISTKQIPTIQQVL